MFGKLLAVSSKDVRDDYQKGPNMSRTAVDKIYGWFIKQMQSINPDKSPRDIVSMYSSPTIVMIGSESTGKSATIENITKVPIFPTAAGICTRCPIKVSLIPEEIEGYSVTFRNATKRFTAGTKGDLKTCITAYFAEIAATCPIGYTMDEIRVTIERKDVMRIDIVDLPGMVSYPAEAKTFTCNLCQQYINDQNNFILCVANSTIPRLTSYEPIARIIESKACKRSIIVLTMADKLDQADYESHLIQRIIGESDELKEHAFSACCAVINRTGASITLDMQTGIEKAFFEKNILDLLRKHGGKQQMQYANKIQDNAGIEKLLHQVNDKFEDYIKTQWVPGTVAEIDKTVASLRASVVALGDTVTEANLADFQARYTDVHNSIYAGIFSAANINFLFMNAGTNDPRKVEEVDPPAIVSKIQFWIKTWTIAATLTPTTPAANTPLGRCMLPPYCLQRFEGFFAEVRSAFLAQLEAEVAPALLRLHPVILANQYTNVTANAPLINAVLTEHMGRLRAAGEKQLTVRVGMEEDCQRRNELEAKISKNLKVKGELQLLVKDAK